VGFEILIGLVMGFMDFSRIHAHSGAFSRIRGWRRRRRISAVNFGNQVVVGSSNSPTFSFFLLLLLLLSIII
jgi:hypothetical protein